MVYFTMRLFALSGDLATAVAVVLFEAVRQQR
jgi:tRNA(Leu) C34 or U34 (ribose-2'-O)-methylase TrmL